MTASRKAVSGMGFSLLGAIVLTKIFYRWPDLFPSSLRNAGNMLVNLSGAQSVEVSSDIELAIVLVTSFVTSGLAIVVVMLLYSRLAHRNGA